MLSKRNRLAVTAAAAVTVAAAVVSAGPAMASGHQLAAPVSAGAHGRTLAAPIDFVEMPARPLPAGQQMHEFTVTYRNGTSTDQVVAPQLLVESPDAGPFLKPSDVKLERLTGAGHWKAVRLASQTGTLYTDLSRVKHRLHSGETLVQRYRLSVVTAGAVGTVGPRAAIFG
ncbi:hypothetical protein [Kitasatospora kifunensis]|uniref:Uncharacterized protein n=1 Tax=Kitasatospora kifunensis TaxID=58351 RepID=A0A7W7VZP8_KITKI|nr:hypothetical protein [Kitasatospora kifunensis]MBB4927944.1 hypothetical protein [Kitasatospora kifunensis]